MYLQRLVRLRKKSLGLVEHPASSLRKYADCAYILFRTLLTIQSRWLFKCLIVDFAGRIRLSWALALAIGAGFT